MVKNLFSALGVVAVLIVAAPSVHAQQTPPGAKPEEAKATPAAKGDIAPLRLQLTISRYQGDKKISSLPYSLSVSTQPGLSWLTRMRSCPWASARLRVIVMRPPLLME